MLRRQPASISDEELMQSICRRDESALDLVIQIYGGQVNAVCQRICKDDLEASGVVSEVFWELWRNATLFQSHRGSLRSYLLTMARSRALDRWRTVSSQNRQQHKFLESSGQRVADFTSNELPDHRPVNEESAQEVHTALSQLPPLQRQALLLAFFDGMSHREVSQELDVPLGSVKTHIRSGLIKLRRLLASMRERQELS